MKRTPVMIAIVTLVLLVGGGLVWWGVSTPTLHAQETTLVNALQPCISAIHQTSHDQAQTPGVLAVDLHDQAQSCTFARATLMGTSVQDALVPIRDDLLHMSRDALALTGDQQTALTLEQQQGSVAPGVVNDPNVIGDTQTLTTDVNRFNTDAHRLNP